MYLREVALKAERTAEAYVYEIPLIRQFERLCFHQPVTFLCGENGTGKSTLLEAIAVAAGFNAEGGSRNQQFSTYDTHSKLACDLRLIRTPNKIKDGYFLRAESFYNVATEIDKNEQEMCGLLRSYGGKSLHQQSHGESFFSLLTHRFFGHGLYLLDEPEAALSLNRQLAMLTLIDDLVKADSQFIIATHSPILLAYPHAEIYVCDENGLTLTPYTQTENYQLMRHFLENPQRYLKLLLDDSTNDC